MLCITSCIDSVSFSPGTHWHFTFELSMVISLFLIILSTAYPEEAKSGSLAGDKTYRIGLGGLWHESNTFNPQSMTLDDFTRGDKIFSHWLRGKEIVDKFQHEENHTGGAVKALLERADVEIVPLVCAGTTPGGPISDQAYERLLNDMLTAIGDAGKLDGLVFANHGAMVTESIKDADGDMLKNVRNLVGPDIPISVALDFHANISRDVISHADIVVVYKRYPHIDRHETGYKAAELLAKTVAGEIMPQMAFIKLPIMPGLLKQLTEQEPMKSINNMLYAAEDESDILSCSLAGGFPYADVPQASSSIIAISNGDKTQAESCARRIAETYWNRRHEFKNELISPEEAVSAAALEKDGPVLLVDTGDNIGGGTPADGTLLLRLLYERNMPGVVIIHDPSAVNSCIKAGIGEDITIAIGGKFLTVQGGPVKVSGRIRTLFEGRYFETGIPDQGLPESFHPMALLIADNLKIILTTHRLIPEELAQLRAMGVTPEEEKLIVVKAAVAWREFYGTIAKRVFLVATPGYTSINPNHFKFRHLTRPLYPLDEEVKWPE